MTNIKRNSFCLHNCLKTYDRSTDDCRDSGQVRRADKTLTNSAINNRWHANVGHRTLFTEPRTQLALTVSLCTSSCELLVGHQVGSLNTVMYCILVYTPIATMSTLGRLTHRSTVQVYAVVDVRATCNYRTKLVCGCWRLTLLVLCQAWEGTAAVRTVVELFETEPYGTAVTSTLYSQLLPFPLSPAPAFPVPPSLSKLTSRPPKSDCLRQFCYTSEFQGLVLRMI